MLAEKKILIIEDEKPMARALELKLSYAGFKTQIVFSGEEGLTALEKGRFDLIILDLVMPKMDGFTFLKELAKRNIKTKVIVTSNLSQAEDEERAKKLGAQEYLIKSNTPLARIVNQVKKILKV